MSLVADLRNRLERMERKLDGVQSDVGQIKGACPGCRERIASHDDSLDDVRVRVALIEHAQARRLKIVSAVWAVVTTLMGVAIGIAQTIFR